MKTHEESSLEPTRDRLAWASAIFEGVNVDGYNMQLALTRQDNEYIPREYCKLFGGLLRTDPKRPNVLFWYTSGPRARGILMTLLFAGYLSPKKRIETMVALKVNLLRGTTTTSRKSDC